MAKWRRRSIEIEADVFQWGMQDGFDFEHELTPNSHPIGHVIQGKFFTETIYPYIFTLEGKMYVNPGDYICIGLLGERYPCKAAVFHLLNEPIENSDLQI